MNFIEQIDAKIQEKHLLKHPMYVAWSKGELKLEYLKEYAEDYYPHVEAFPTYISAIHAKSKDKEVRRELLKNLIEEENGSPNHPELWIQFAEKLGAKNISSTPSNKDIESLIKTFTSICQNGSTADGIAALYAYESQIPSICISKIDGLKKHYGITDPSTYKYFSVHIGADEEHSASEREMLKQLITKDNFESVLKAVDQILDGLNQFLSGLSHRFGIQCAA